MFPPLSIHNGRPSFEVKWSANAKNCFNGTLFAFMPIAAVCFFRGMLKCIWTPMWIKGPVHTGSSHHGMVRLSTVVVYTDSVTMWLWAETARPAREGVSLGWITRCLPPLPEKPPTHVPPQNSMEVREPAALSGSFSSSSTGMPMDTTRTGSGYVSSKTARRPWMALAWARGASRAKTGCRGGGGRSRC